MRKHLVILGLFFSTSSFTMDSNNPVKKLQEAFGEFVEKRKQKKLRRIQSQIEKKKTINTEQFETWAVESLSRDEDDLAKLMMETTAKSKITWDDVFHAAVEKQEVVSIEKLLKAYSVNPNKPDSNGITPLFKALKKVAHYKKEGTEKEIETAINIVSRLIESEKIDFSIRCQDATPAEFVALNKLSEVETLMKKTPKKSETCTVDVSEILEGKKIGSQPSSGLFNRFRSLSLSTLKRDEKRK
ncbi:MAG TPA: hypothetical protein VHO47_05755 [Candidatus Babeliales bacterium]|nr:hypothetical protein [Candidatus Babeliales bacterium]